MTVAQLPRDDQLCGPFQSIPEPWQEQFYTSYLRTENTDTFPRCESDQWQPCTAARSLTVMGAPWLTKCCHRDMCLAATYSEVLRGTLRARSQGATVCICQATAQWLKARQPVVWQNHSYYSPYMLMWEEEISLPEFKSKLQS